MTTWIFQGSPDHFDLEGYLASDRHQISWLVRRYAERMRPGDVVYLWQAAGKKRAVSGILASATIISDVWSGPDDIGARAFWINSEASAEVATRVSLRIGAVATGKHIVKREWLREDPICSDLLILKQSAGTNYPITSRHAQRLSDLWSNTGTKWSRAESLAALETYLATYGGPLSKVPGSPVADLSLQVGRAVGGAYNKVLNFRALDPRDERAGLSGGSDVDEAVWEEFFDAAAGEVDHARLDTAIRREWPDAWAKSALAEQRKSLEDRVEAAMAQGADALRERLKKGASEGPAQSTLVESKVYNRSADVIAYARLRACDRCELPGCRHPTFERLDGTPFVEVHHIITLADGGSDSINNVACLCPSHHREIHLGRNAKQLQDELLALRAAE